MSNGERRAWNSMFQGYFRKPAISQRALRPWPTGILPHAMVYPTGDSQIMHLPLGRAKRPVGHSASEQPAKHSIEVEGCSRKWSKHYSNMGPTLPPRTKQPLSIPARQRGGKEGAQACTTSHSFLFLLLPTHQGVFTLTSMALGQRIGDSAGRGQ